MYIYPHPVYPRASRERLFKQFYNLALVFNFATFIISFSDFYNRVDNTYSNYWHGDDYELHKPLREILTNCTYNHTITVNGLTATTTMTLESAPFGFLTMTSLIIAIFVLHGLLIGTDFLAKAFYAVNVRNLRVKGCYVRLNLILMVFIFLYSVAAVTAIAASHNVRSMQQDFVNFCADRYSKLYEDKYIGTEHDVDVLFGTNLWWILAGVSVNAFVYLLAFLTLTAYNMKHSTSVIQAEKHPWEKGLLCKPDKPKLIEFCRIRKMKVDLIDRKEYTPGQPIVLSPQHAAADMYAADYEGSPLPAEYALEEDPYGGQGYGDGAIPYDGGVAVDVGQELELEDPEKKKKKRKHRKSRTEGEGDDEHRRHSRRHRSHRGQEGPADTGDEQGQGDDYQQ